MSDLVDVIAGGAVRRRDSLLVNFKEARKNMSLETVLIWLGIGLIAGWLASAMVGGGYGVIGDIVVGIVGSFLGGMIFRGLHIRSPLGGVPGMILVAFVGALALLVLIRIVRATTARRRP